MDAQQCIERIPQYTANKECEDPHASRRPSLTAASLSLPFACSRISIDQHPVDFRTYLSQISFQRLRIFEFPVCFRLFHERLQQGFLFEEWLKGVCDLGVRVDEMATWFRCGGGRGRFARGRRFLGFRYCLSCQQLNARINEEDKIKAYLKGEHVLLQEQIRPCQDGHLDPVLGTALPAGTWQLTDPLRESIVLGERLQQSFTCRGGFRSGTLFVVEVQQELLELWKRVLDLFLQNHERLQCLSLRGQI